MTALLAVGALALIGQPSQRSSAPSVAPAKAASAGKRAMIATRKRFFGTRNVDSRTGAVRRDRVILSWFGVTNFALAIRGRVVLLDAWVPRGAHSGYVPTSPEELARLRPKAIFIGHAHFDHAADGVPLALATGAKLVGTAEHCEALRGRTPAATTPPRCVAAIPAGAPTGARSRLDLLRGVGVRVVKHLHSGATAPDGEDGFHAPVLPPPATTSVEHPPTPEDVIETLGRLPDAEGGTLLYRFRAGRFSLAWHDSSGPLTDQAPEVSGLLRRLRPVDVHVGAIQGFNQVTNGMRDPIHYIKVLRPGVFVPSHHDDWAAGITTRGANYEQPFFEALERIPAKRRPRVRFIRDPDDYVRPRALTFRSG